VRILASDRDLGVPRLRLTRWYEGTEPDGPAGAACPADGSLLRAYIDPGDGALHLQRVAAPSALAAYDAWSALGTVEVGAGVGLHAAGAYVALAYYDGTDVRVRFSADSGATFAAGSTVAVVGGVTAVACAVRADGSAAIAWATGGVVYAVRRTGTGSWSSPAAWSESLGSVNALAMSDDADWCVFVSGEDADGNAGAWTTRLGSGLGAPPGVWLPLTRVILAAPGTDVSYRATSVGLAGASRLALVESYAGTGAFDQPMLTTAIGGTTFDDQLWRDPVPIAQGSTFGVAITGVGSSAYLVTSSGVWHASIASAAVDLTAAVLDVRYESTASGERLTATFDASEVELEQLHAGAEITFEPGYVSSEGVEVAGGRVLWVTEVEHVRREGRSTVTVKAEGAPARLREWHAPRQLVWAAGDSTILLIATEIARLAGVRILTSVPSVAATTLTPAFTVRAGESAATALHRLFDRTEDVLLERGSAVIVAAAEPDEDPLVEFVAGGADADAFTSTAMGVIDEMVGPSWARVLGEGVAAQAVDLEGLARGGSVALAVDEAVTGAGIAADRAAAILRRGALEREHGWIESAVHPGIERGDVVAVTDAALNLDDAHFRVTSVRIDYARRSRGRFQMRLGLGAV